MRVFTPYLLYGYFERRAAAQRDIANVYGWSEADKVLTVIHRFALRAGALVCFWPKVNIRVIGAVYKAVRRTRRRAADSAND